MEKYIFITNVQQILPFSPYVQMKLNINLSHLQQHINIDSQPCAKKG